MNIQVYVINLPKNYNRLTKFLKNYRNSDLNSFKLNIFEAVNGKEINIEEHVTPEALEQIKETEKTGVRTHHHHLTKGAVGCYLSHLGIYKKILEENSLDSALIFEDDSTIPLNLYDIILENLLIIPKDWDIINFGCMCVKCTDKVLYQIPERFFLTNCYLINLAGVKKILGYHENHKIDKQIDSELSLMASNKKINLYCSKTFIGQNNFKTDIQMPLRNNIFSDPFDMNTGSCKNTLILIGMGVVLLIIMGFGIFLYLYLK